MIIARRNLRLALACVAGCVFVYDAGAQALDLSRYQKVDLTHSLNAKTLYWPTSPTTPGVNVLRIAAVARSTASYLRWMSTPASA